MSDFVVRPIVAGDLETICRHRHEMFKVSGRTDEMVAPMTEHFRPWLRPLLDDERYFGWFIEAGDGPVAGVGMMIIDWPPHPSHPTQRARGYVLNMYVEPEYRRAGLGGRLMELCHQEARKRGVRHLILHATRQGRGLYEKLGWAATSEMSLTFEH